MEQPAACLRSEGLGLAGAAFRFRREAHAVSAAADGRQQLRIRQMVFSGWQFPTDRIDRPHHDAEGIYRSRGAQDPNRLGYCDTSPGAGDLLRTAECEELDGDE